MRTKDLSSTYALKQSTRERSKSWDRDRDQGRERERARDRGQEQGSNQSRDRERVGSCQRDRDGAQSDYDGHKRISRISDSSGRNRSKERGFGDRGRSRSRDRAKPDNTDRATSFSTQSPGSRTWQPGSKDLGAESAKREDFSKHSPSSGFERSVRNDADSKSILATMPIAEKSESLHPKVKLQAAADGREILSSQVGINQGKSISSSCAQVQDQIGKETAPSLAALSATHTQNVSIQSQNLLPEKEDTKKVVSDTTPGRSKHRQAVPGGWQIEDVDEGCAVWQGRLGKAAGSGSQVALFLILQISICTGYIQCYIQ